MKIKRAVLKNMGKRASSLLCEDIYYIGPIFLEDIIEARKCIGKIILKLDELGDIDLPENLF